jgi:hypothetical protein
VLSSSGSTSVEPSTSSTGTVANAVAAGAMVNKPKRVTSRRKGA